MKQTTFNKILPTTAFLLLALWGIVSGQTISVSGHITSESDHASVVGATISIQRTSKGTISDVSGNYRLDGVSPNDTLVFSYVGFQKKIVPVQNKSIINVTLQPNVSQLNQLVVIGYGTAMKKDLTGAVGHVNAVKLQNENPISVQDVLRSNVPGLEVGVSTSAKPGGSLQIRGKNTLNAGSSPLIVLDGVIYYGSMADINPQDIQSVDVLKDASAAAVYGAKSANGVILITTKKGKSGKPVINFNANFGVATMEVNQPVYGAEGFLKWRTQVKRSSYGFNEKPYQFNDPRQLPSNISVDDWLAYDGSSGDPVKIWLNRLNLKPIEIKDYELGRSINWYDKVFQKGIQQNYTISLSGGSDKFNYYWSGGYLSNEGIVVGDKYSTINSRLKLEGQVTNWLTVGVNTQFAVRDESQVPVSWGLIVNNSPWGSMYNDDSTDYRYSPQDDPGTGAKNPFSVPKYTDRSKKYYTLNSIIYSKISLPFGITYTMNFTPEFEWYQYLNHQSSEYQDWANLGGIATREQHTQYRWQIDNILSWKRTFNKVHHFEVTLLANAEKYQIWRNSMTNNAFDPSDILGYHNIGAGTNPIVTSGPGDYSDMNDTKGDEYSTGSALMGRLFYSYKERYLLTLSVRRDGYSAFGQEHPYANFPAAALGWVFSEEPFFKSNWFNYGKLRLSYGVNGNRDIGRYVALSDLNTGKYLEIASDGSVRVVSQLYVNTMANPNLKWEQTASFNAGLDFSLFKDVLSGTFNVYKSKTTNLLVSRRLPITTGFSSVFTNLGEVDNHGFEIELNSNNIQHQNFSWRSSFNFSVNRNKIVHLYGDMVDVKDANGKVIGQKESDDITNKWFIGHAIDAVWDIKVLGVYKTAEKDIANKYGQSPGDYKLQDVNKDGQYTNDDRSFLGNTEPRYRWTLRNEFTLMKNFNVSFLIYSLWGHMASFNHAKNRDGFPDRTNSYNLPYWTPEHQINDYARIYSSDGSASYSVYWKRSFIRLDNIAVSYNFNKRLLEKANIEALKLYFTVKNAAFYAPDWPFWDPEWASGGDPGPTPRTYTLGINLTL